jgi:ribosomal protein L11 methyltransferase
MDYTKVSFEIAPNSQDNRDIAIALLSQFDYDTFEETKKGVDAFIKKELFNKNEVESILPIIKNNFEINYTIEEIENKNWNEEWEKNFNPVFINEKCVIRASFHEIDPIPEVDVIITPKMAFGTGHHQTSFLIAHELFELKLRNKYILDMGCGTGILAIIASKLGAKEIIAIDNDSDAVTSSKENLKINKTKNIKTFLGNANLLKKYKNFDFILANINRNIILNDIDKYASVLSKKGKLLLSGFYQKDLPIILEEAEKHGFVLDKFNIKEEWAMATLKFK